MTNITNSGRNILGLSTDVSRYTKEMYFPEDKSQLYQLSVTQINCQSFHILLKDKSLVHATLSGRKDAAPQRKIQTFPCSQFQSIPQSQGNQRW